MTTKNENVCFRNRTDCTPVANLCTEVDANDFICVGWNSPESRAIQSDRFTLCWKNDVIDERGHWDKRDLLDTMSVISQALSIDENVRVNEGIDELTMQQVNMVL